MIIITIVRFTILAPWYHDKKMYTKATVLRSATGQSKLRGKNY